MEPCIQGSLPGRPSLWLRLLESRSARAGLIAITLVPGPGIKLSMAPPASADGPLDGVTESVSKTASDKLSSETKKADRTREETSKSVSQRAERETDASTVTVESVRTTVEPAAKPVVETAAPLAATIAPVIEQTAPAQDAVAPVLEALNPVVDTKPIVAAVGEVLMPINEVIAPITDVLPAIDTILDPLPVATGADFPNAAGTTAAFASLKGADLSAEDDSPSGLASSVWTLAVDTSSLPSPSDSPLASGPSLIDGATMIAPAAAPNRQAEDSSAHRIAGLPATHAPTTKTGCAYGWSARTQQPTASCPRLTMPSSAHAR